MASPGTPIAESGGAPPTLRDVPRTAKGERTRGRLLRAAKHVFERQGFLGARVSDIADRARISHGTFYHYFNSKEEIFRELAEAQEARTDRSGGCRRRTAVSALTARPGSPGGPALSGAIPGASRDHGRD